MVESNRWNDLPGSGSSWDTPPAETGANIADRSGSGAGNWITVSGSRDVDRETARSLFEQHLSNYLSQGRTWLIGGSHGIDEWAMEWLLEHHEVCWVVVPYTRAKQPKWSHSLLEQMDRVVELQLPKRKTAHAFRNRYMVDLSGIVFGFWSGQGGGTVKTLKYALRKRRQVHGIPVSLQAEDG